MVLTKNILTNAEVRKTLNTKILPMKLSKYFLSPYLLIDIVIFLKANFYLNNFYWFIAQGEMRGANLNQLFAVGMITKFEP